MTDVIDLTDDVTPWKENLMGPAPTPPGLGLSDLLDFQEVDLAIDRLIHQRQTLPELASYQQAAGRRERLNAIRAGKAVELRSLELDLDKAEGELELVEIKLKESETRLFAGGMSGRETEQKRSRGAIAAGSTERTRGSSARADRSGRSGSNGGGPPRCAVGHDR